ncbi:MAG: hypothetical protein IJT34_03860, partial [Butyrivibrio sp.]|nr:hypothetical protein [Butyrivibrio sp.]
MPRPNLQGMTRHLYKQSCHEQMREYYNSLPTMEEKADFLFSLNYMQLSGQLTSEEQGVFRELQTDYFFPLASDGQLDFPLHMMRLKSFHQRQIRLQEEMGQMVWAQLTPEERDQLRRYHEELKYQEELDKKNEERIKNGEIPLPPLDHDPVFPKSVANKMAQVYFRTPEGAAYQSMSSMSFMLTNVSEPRLKNYLQSHHISEDDYYDGGMGSDMQSKVRDQVVIQDTMWESTHHTYDGFRLDPQQDQLSLMEGYQMIGRYMYDTGLPNYDAFSYKQRSENTMVAEEALNDRIDRTFLGEPPAEPIHFINTACDKTEALDQKEADNIFHKKLLSRYGVPNVFEGQSHNETEEMARDRIRRMKRLADTAHAYIQAQEDPEARREIRNQINGWIDQGQLNNNEGSIYMKLLQGEYFLKTSDGLQMLEEYHNCKTPRERAEFLDRAMVLEQSGLLTEDEVDAVNRIQSEFLGPMKNGQLDMEAARENVLAFRRITAAADLRLGAKRQQMEEELPARIKGKDRRKIADYLVAHTTIEGAMKKRRDAFFSAMR